MPRSYTSLHTHVVFSTHERAPLIQKPHRQRLHDYLGGIARNLGAIPRRVGGVADHVHVLATLPQTMSVAEFVNKIKANSSSWYRELVRPHEFAWQRGYGAFSVSPSALDNVIRYIDRQEEHHSAVSFRDEFVRFLNEAGIEYDERYLFA